MKRLCVKDRKADSQLKMLLWSQIQWFECCSFWRVLSKSDSCEVAATIMAFCSISFKNEWHEHVLSVRERTLPCCYRAGKRLLLCSWRPVMPWWSLRRSYQAWSHWGTRSCSYERQDSISQRENTGNRTEAGRKQNGSRQTLWWSATLSWLYDSSTIYFQDSSGIPPFILFKEKGPLEIDQLTRRLFIVSFLFFFFFF